MKPLSKIVFPMSAALLVSGLLLAALQPRSAKAFARHLLAVRSRESDSSLSSSRAKSLPPITFWAWERPEDLRFLKANEAGVAFLAETIYLTARGPASGAPSFIVRPRLQPLRIASGSQLVAVVRIEKETPARVKAAARQAGIFAGSLSSQAEFRDSLASEISQLQSLPGVAAVQIDFDATTSEHAFYSALLQDVRRKLPNSMPLSITALASWCVGDRWLTQLPPGTIDEAVPMLFRMGPDSAKVANFLRSGSDFPVAACRASLGLSTDEPLSQILLASKLAGISSALKGKRVYVFSPSAWTEPAAQRILAELQP